MFLKFAEMTKSINTYFLALLDQTYCRFLKNSNLTSMTSDNHGSQNKIHEMKELKKLSPGHSYEFTPSIAPFAAFF